MEERRQEEFSPSLIDKDTSLGRGKDRLRVKDTGIKEPFEVLQLCSVPAPYQTADRDIEVASLLHCHMIHQLYLPEGRACSEVRDLLMKEGFGPGPLEWW